jgi:hypothetical protein
LYYGPREVRLGAGKGNFWCVKTTILIKKSVGLKERGKSVRLKAEEGEKARVAFQFP